MTEAEWLACTDPDTILFHPFPLGANLIRRKLVLFLAAYIRRRLPEASRNLAERYEREVEELDRPAQPGPPVAAAPLVVAVSPFGVFPQRLPEGGAPTTEPPRRADGGQPWEIGFMARKYASQVAHGLASSEVTGDTSALYQPAFRSELRYQCMLLRDLFANPFRPVAVDPAWRTPGVVELARIIYEDRAFERMPELADALEEAGCTDPEILDHCRGPGEHVRGCWVVDLALGKT